MQETATSPSPTASSFANLLAALASPAPERAPEWNEDGLADDVATLSYEQALSSNARYRSADTGTSPNQHDGAPWQTHYTNASSGPGVTARPATDALPTHNRNTVAEARDAKRPTACEANRKSASITIRMSKEEGTQLRERAAEAGLTISAYLRSCVFEAETLRTQVKEALVQLRSPVASDEKKSPAPASSSSPTWRLRLFPRWSGSHGAAQA